MNLHDESRKPEKVYVDPDNLPPELLNTKTFCCWSWEWQSNRWSKRPMNPYTGMPGHTNNREEFSDLETALNAMEKYDFDGIGLGLFEISGIDIDHVIAEDGRLMKLAAQVLNIMSPCYAEYSPSGSGIHMLFTCNHSFTKESFKKAYKIKNDNIENSGSDLEVYLSSVTARFLTLTGHQFDNGCEPGIYDKTEEVNSVLKKWMCKEDSRNSLSPVPFHNSDNNVGAVCRSRNPFDGYVIAKASEHSKLFEDMFYHGYTETVLGRYPSRSQADLAFMIVLAYWTDRDPIQMDRIMQQAAAYREKWEREDYKSMTIANACQRIEKSYSETLQEFLEKTTPEERRGYVLAKKAKDIRSRVLSRLGERSET